jgi:hypothetical protein
MYSNGFVVSVFVGSQVINEEKGNRVRLPFGAEYTIRLRNKNDRDAVAYVNLDGEDVNGDGVGIIVKAGQHVDLEQSVKLDGKFRFVSSSSQAAAQAGKAGDPNKQNGVLRVSWKLEKEPEPILHTFVPRGPAWQPHDSRYNDERIRKGPIRRDIMLGAEPNIRSLRSLSMNASPEPLPTEDGCTVTGSASGQRFSNGSIGQLEEHETVMSLFLVGTTVGSAAEVTEPPKAGSAWIRNRFCHQCGYEHTTKGVKFCASCGVQV